MERYINYSINQLINQSGKQTNGRPTARRTRASATARRQVLRRRGETSARDGEEEVGEQGASSPNRRAVDLQRTIACRRTKSKIEGENLDRRRHQRRNRAATISSRSSVSSRACSNDRVPLDRPTVTRTSSSDNRFVTIPRRRRQPMGIDQRAIRPMGMRLTHSSTNHHRPVDKPSSSSSNKRRVGGPVDFTEVLRIAEANKRGERVPTPPPPKKMVKAFKSNSGEDWSSARGWWNDQKTIGRRIIQSWNRRIAIDRHLQLRDRHLSHQDRRLHRGRIINRHDLTTDRMVDHHQAVDHRTPAVSSSKRSSGSGGLMVNGGGVNIDDLSPDQLREMIARLQKRLGGGGGERRKEKRPRHEEPRRERVEKCSTSQYSAKPNCTFRLIN